MTHKRSTLRWVGYVVQYDTGRRLFVKSYWWLISRKVVAVECQHEVEDKPGIQTFYNNPYKGICRRREMTNEGTLESADTGENLASP